MTVSNAGAPKKPKTGGRKAGVPNKKTAALQAEVAASGETPLAFMLRVMRDPKKKWEARMEMAKAAAPYVHAKLASVEVYGTGEDGAIITDNTITIELVSPR